MQNVTTIKVIRRFSSGNHIFGDMYFEDQEKCEHTCVTLERRDKCLKTGLYLLHIYDSPSRKGKKDQWLWLVQENPQRFIEIHIGNTLDDTDGCILVGTGIGSVYNKPAVINSTTAFESLMSKTTYIENGKHFGNETTFLDVRDYSGIIL